MSQVNSLKILVFIFFLFFIFNLFNCERLIEDWEVNSLTCDFIRWHAQTFPGEIAISDERKIDIELFNPDLKNIASINEQLNRFAGRIMLVDTSSISFKSRVNFFILKNKINYLLFEFQEWKRWQYDSYFYTEKLFDTLEILKSQPAESSTKISVKFLGSIKAIPGFLNNARKNLIQNKINNIDNALAPIEIIKTMLPVQIANITISDTLILDSLNYVS